MLSLVFISFVAGLIHISVLFNLMFLNDDVPKCGLADSLSALGTIHSNEV